MTCQEVLLKYFNESDGWHKKVHLYAIAEDFSPETVGRALRTLSEGENAPLKVSYYNGKITKNLAQYAKSDYHEPVKKYKRVELESGEIIYQEYYE